MGVCFVAYAVSDTNIAQCLADPPLIWRVVEHGDEGAYRRELEQQTKTSLLSRLLGKPKPEAEIKALEFSECELRDVDLDKSWDGLRACLQQLAPTTPNFFEGSGQVGKIEIGYGPALYHRSETMNRIARDYGGITEEQLVDAYRTLDLKDLYPKGLWQKQDAEIESYLTENFLELQSFLKHIEAHSLGAVLQFT
jgi:hypothetical protein